MIRFTVLKCILFYQKHLSHRKGYKCAHGVLHGNTTCSAAILNIVKEKSITKWYSLSKKQFESCKNSKIEIDKIKKDKKKKDNCSDCIPFPQNANCNCADNFCDIGFCDIGSCS